MDNPKSQRCVLCGHIDSYRTAFGAIEVAGRSYSVERCSDCGLSRTSPFLGEKELKEIYSSEVYREDDATRFFSPVEKILGFVREQRCLALEALVKAKGRILDVGCGRGDFPALMAARGWQASGIELDERIITHGRKVKGVELGYGGIDDVKFPDSSFDAVTFWHVFEHLRAPGRAIDEARRILRPAGVLLVAVPNMGSWQARLSGKHWFHLDPPYHLYHYSLDNLKHLLEGRGFKVEKVRHFSLEYGPYGFLQSLYNAMGLRRNLLYDFLRSRYKKDAPGYFGLALMALLMPVVLPLSFVLSVLEALAGAGGAIEIYARKAS